MYTFWLVIVSLIWGSTFFLIKETVDSVNEHFIVLFRGFSAFLFMFLYQLKVKPKALKDRKGIIYGLILGFLLAITYLSQTIGLKYTTTGHSAFITSSAVIVVPFLLFLFFKHRLSFADTIAVSIVMVGLYLLTYDTETPINKGDLITIITAVACALHIVFAGHFVNKAETLTIVTYQFLGTSIFSFIAWIVSGETTITLSLKSFGSLLYLGIIGTLVCYFISVWVQKYVTSLKVAVIFSLEPVFAAFFGYFALHETLNFKESIGAVLILVGVLAHSLLKSKNITFKGLLKMPN